ncbi:PTS system, nitrogen regulatory IIA component [Serratia symbiotica str. 'Cinara cedri']|nr:PTS system, nitrogen regulatory IIA component [Serratia symbiotica str. 'Cinara cedri']
MDNKYKKLRSALNIKCTKIIIHFINKKWALNIISTLASTTLQIQQLIIFNTVLTNEYIENTNIGNSITISCRALKNNILKTVSIFIHLKQPITFNIIDNQRVDRLFTLLKRTNQCKTYLHILFLTIKLLANNTICCYLRTE